MNITLLKKEIKSNWLLLTIFLAVLTMYGVMVTMMYEPELGESLKMMAESMPEIFAAFGMAEVGETLLEFLSGYLYGMLFVAFPGVFIIILTNRLCAKYVEIMALWHICWQDRENAEKLCGHRRYLWWAVWF